MGRRRRKSDDEKEEEEGYEEKTKTGDAEEAEEEETQGLSQMPRLVGNVSYPNRCRPITFQFVLLSLLQNWLLQNYFVLVQITYAICRCFIVFIAYCV